MDINDILEMMDELLDKAPAVPFSSQKCIVDSSRMRDLINDVRLNLPQEIKRAKLIDFDCERILKEAETKGDAIIRRAEDRAKVLVSEEEILKEAKQKATDVLAAAQARKKEISSATFEYADNMLGQVELFLSSNLADAKRTRQTLSASATKKGNPDSKKSNNSDSSANN